MMTVSYSPTSSNLTRRNYPRVPSSSQMFLISNVFRYKNEEDSLKAGAYLDDNHISGDSCESEDRLAGSLLRSPLCCGGEQCPPGGESQHRGSAQCDRAEQAV